MTAHQTIRRATVPTLMVVALSLLACNLQALIGSAPTPTAEPTSTPAPTETTAAPSIVQNAVMAQQVSGDNFEPVGVTNTFPSNQNVFHAVVTIANAPDNTDFQVNWLASDGTQIGTFDLKSSGSRNLDFSFKPDAGKLPTGKYSVQLLVNGSLATTLEFSVSTVAQTQPTRVQPTIAAKPSGLVGSVTMAKGTQGDDKQPVNPTTAFNNADTFHAVVHVVSAPSNTKFNAAWYVVDVGGSPAANSLINHTEVTTDGTRNIDFTLAPQSTWPVGLYRVEISVNGTVDTVRQFSVQ